MGLIVEVSPLLDVELRRESVVLIPQTEDEGDFLELHYRYVFALEDGVKEIIGSSRFQEWLKKQEKR